MPHRYVVPQFIDVEDKILGPLTVRQFLLMLTSVFLGFLAYKVFDFTLFLFVAVVDVVIFGAFAFYKVNGQPLHYFVLNALQTYRRAHTRIWDKELDTEALQHILKEPPPPPPKPKVVKQAIEESRLSELTLIVNTGGVYTPEKD